MSGKFASVGGKVSCKRSLPSLRLRQIVWSGYDKYVTHFPSRENVNSMRKYPAEERHELLRLHVIADQFATPLRAKDKICFPIPARARDRGNGHW